MGNDKSQIEKDARFLLDTLERKSGVVSETLAHWQEHLRIAQKSKIINLQERKSYDACLSDNIDELRRITHQINACLKACENGNIEEMEKLHEQILNAKKYLH